MKMTMRKMLAILATLAILCAVLPLGALFSAVADDTNLVVNGGFESGKDNWSCNSGEAVIVNDAHSGDAALSLTNPAMWGEAAMQSMPVDSNSQYTITWYSKRVAGKGAFNLYVMNGSNWANLTIKGNNWMNETSGKWVKNELVVETGSATSMAIKFSSETTNAGTILIDDVSVVKVGGGSTPDVPDVPVSGSLLANGDFETGDLSGWAPFQQTVISADAAHSGSYGAHLKGDGSWGGLLDQTVTVESGKTYTLTFWYKALGAGANFVVKSKGVSLASHYGSATAWTKIELEFTADADTVLLNICGGGTKVAEDVYVDDVVLTVKGEEPDQPDVPSVGDFANGDFETGDLSGWTPWQQTVISADAAHGGSYGAHLKGDGGWGGLLDKDLAVESGKTYILTFWYKALGAGANFVVKSNGASLASHYGSASAWTKIELEFTADADTALLNICGGGTNVAEDLYVDDFVLSLKGSEPDVPDVPDQPDQPTYGDFVNGDFEDGSNGWQLNETFASIVDDAHSGNGALRIENPTAWAEAALQAIRVEPNTDYVIKVWLKYAEGTGTFNLALMDGATNANVKVAEGSQNWFKNSGDAWVSYVIEFNSASSTSVKFKWTSESNNSGVLLVDDMTVAVKGEDPKPQLGTILNGNFEDGTVGWALGPSASITDDVLAGVGALRIDNPTAWAEAALQTVPVEANTDYVIKVWIRFDEGTGPFNLAIMDGVSNANLSIAEGSQNWFTKNGADWTEYSIEFNTGDSTSAKFKWTSEADNAGVLLVDNMALYKKGEEPNEPDEPIEPPTVSLSLLTFGVAANRPQKADDNLILNGDFEADGGQWQDLLGDTLYIVDDETAPSGNKSLYFNTSGVAESTKLVFWLDVTPNTDYVFSTWIKGAFISDENRYNATVGVVDEREKFLVCDSWSFSNKERQLVPTAWDNEWHLRSVSFNSGRATRVGVAFAGSQSQMWIDDMALFMVENSVKYVDPLQGSHIGPMPTYREEGGCAEEDSLIPDVNMDDAESVEFWSSALGFENGFISFPENVYEYGTSMKYTESSNPCSLYMIKWVEVKPHTDYTFSVDIRVVKEGGGKLVLIDSKKRVKSSFMMVDFDQYTYGVDWFSVTCHFDTSEFDRIGIAVVDGGGEALIDNMRLFETSNRLDGGVNDKYVEPPYSFDQPISPDTGVSVVGAVLAVALVPSSAFVAFQLRRKKEDEE